MQRRIAESDIANCRLRSVLTLPPSSLPTPSSLVCKLWAASFSLSSVSRSSTSQSPSGHSADLSSLYSIGTPLVSHASEMLGALSRTLTTYPLRSPMRASISTAYSLLLTSLGASLDPEEGKKSLARVWRCVLEDISAVAVEPVAAASAAEEGGKTGRKSKKQKTTYDPSESFEKRRACVEEMDLAIAERALDSELTLSFSLRSGLISHPPQLLSVYSLLLLLISSLPSSSSRRLASFSSSPSTQPSSAPIPCLPRQLRPSTPRPQPSAASILLGRASHSDVVSCARSRRSASRAGIPQEERSSDLPRFGVGAVWTRMRK